MTGRGFVGWAKARLRRAHHLSVSSSLSLERSGIATIGRDVGIGLNKIPQVAIEIPEDGNRALAFCLWLPDKDDAPGLVGVKVAPEIVGVEEQEYAASGLISDTRRLLIVRGPREQQA